MQSTTKETLPAKITKILVAIDGSELSLKAADMALTISQAFDAKVKLIAVVNQEPFYSVAAGTTGSLMMHIHEAQAELIKKSQDHSKVLLDFAEKRFTEAGITVEKEVAIGYPSEEIMREAEKGDFDLIVIGGKGLTSLTKRMILGSVAERTIYQTKCNVLVVK